LIRRKIELKVKRTKETILINVVLRIKLKIIRVVKEMKIYAINEVPMAFV
jgi:hypothetical protein